jgi:hypothetical protein
MIGIRISVSAPDAVINICPNHHRVVYRASLSRRLTALEQKLGISPEERHQDDPLAVAEDIYITGDRIWNAPASSDQGREQSPNSQTKAKQRVLLFPVVQSALKGSEVTTPTTGVLGVRISLIILYGV